MVMPVDGCAPPGTPPSQKLTPPVAVMSMRCGRVDGAVATTVPADSPALVEAAGPDGSSGGGGSEVATVGPLDGALDGLDGLDGGGLDDGLDGGGVDGFGALATGGLDGFGALATGGLDGFAPLACDDVADPCFEPGGGIGEFGGDSLAICFCFIRSSICAMRSSTSPRLGALGALRR